MQSKNTKGFFCMRATGMPETLHYLDYVRGRHGKIKAIKVGILSRQHHYLGSAQLYSVAI